MIRLKKDYDYEPIYGIFAINNEYFITLSKDNIIFYKISTLHNFKTLKIKNLGEIGIFRDKYIVAIGEEIIYLIDIKTKRINSKIKIL